MPLALQFPISDPILLFGLVLALVLMAPLLAERFKLPGIVGLILAGTLFGPHGLEVLTLGAEIRLLGQVGLVYIMFLAGVEIDLRQFFLLRRHSTIFGVLTFLIPLAAGTLLAPPVLGLSLLAAVLLASMFSSHTLISWPRVSALGLTRQPVVIAAVGGTILTDTLALLLLVFIVGAHAGELTLWFALKLSASILAYVLALVLVLPVMTRWFFRNFAKNGQIEYVYVLSVVFLSSALAHEAGLEPIIGAFFSGLILNRQIPERSTLMNRIHFLGYALFIPFFLLSVGMLVDVRHFFTSRTTLKVTGFMVVVALASKWAAAFASSKLLGWSRTEANLVYGITVNQAAATLAAVMVGVRVGIFSLEIVSGTIGMIIVTCIVGSFVTDRAGQKQARQVPRSTPRRQDTGRIMIPVTGHESLLLDLALLFRKNAGREPLYFLHVIEEGSEMEARVEQAENLLEQALVATTATDVPALPVTRVAMHVGSGMAGAVRDFGVQTVLARLPDPRLRIFSTYSPTLDHLVRHSDCLLILARMETMRFSAMELVFWPQMTLHPGFRSGLEHVLQVARQLNASVRVRVTPEEKGIVEEELSQFSVEFLEPFDMDLLVTPPRDTLRIFYMVRPLGLGWRPSLERVQKRISSSCEGPLWMLFLPETQEKQQNVSIPDVSAGSSFLVSGTEFTHPDPEEAIARLVLASGISEDMVATLARVFMEQCEKDPVELAPGICFLHAHVPGLMENQIQFGRHKNGFRLTSMVSFPKILCILLGPEESTAQEHVTLLAILARTLSQKDVRDALLGGSPILDVEVMLMERMQEQQNRIMGRLKNNEDQPRQ